MPPEENTTETTQTTETKAPETAKSAEPVKADLLSKPTEEAEKKPAEDEKTEEKKPEEKKADAPSIDAKSFKLPEGFQASDEAIQNFIGVVSDEKLAPQERAQKLLDMHVSALQSAAEGPIKTWNDIHEKWISEIASNKEFGTGNPKSPIKPEVAASIGKVFDQYGTPELRNVLSLTGAGNNPEIVSFMSKIAKVLTEGSHKGGNPPGQAKPSSGADAMGFRFDDGRSPANKGT